MLLMKFIRVFCKVVCALLVVKIVFIIISYLTTDLASEVYVEWNKTKSYLKAEPPKSVVGHLH